jgi:chromosome segregation ATPase
VLALEEERRQLLQSQSDTSQLLGEFYSSVSAADDAAGMLSDIEVLSSSIESCLGPLVPKLQEQTTALQIGKVKVVADLESLQFRVIELEKQLDERNQAVEKVSEECASLTALEAEHAKALRQLTKKLKLCDGERLAHLAEGHELRAARDQVPQVLGISVCAVRILQVCL